MILSKVFMMPRKLIDPTLLSDTPDYMIEPLNEIKSENIKHLIGLPGLGGLLGYVVFYEDENIYACPKCDHHISNTFSFCPNCGYKMSSEADEPRKCPGCSHDISSTFTFCPNCSIKLK
ncbi:MAG: zinc ribbon domain-containing protein [Candidatus Fimivivens sp.]|nr:zinc ribbon domain-containing protein [Candidatus Fimivivens sp.]